MDNIIHYNKLSIVKYIVLGLIGGTLYWLIEIIFRGYSHFSMAILGAWCFIALGMINEVIPWSMSLVLQIIIGEVIILVSEFVAGCVLNLWLQLGIWDYSNLSGNIFGQICWQFALLWIPLVAFGIVLDDWVRWRFFGEEMPAYHLV